MSEATLRTIAALANLVLNAATLLVLYYGFKVLRRLDRHGQWWEKNFATTDHG